MQARQNLPEEVVDPAAGTDSLDICYLATGAKRLLVSTDNMVSYLYVLLSSCDTAGQSVLPLSLCFCVWCHHLGNALICPNVDEAFHLLAAPS